MSDTAEQFFDVIKTRRAIRSYTDEPVSDDDLWKIAQAGRWASNGGNLYPHRFLITRDPERIRLIRSFSPGMLVTPSTIVAVMTDEEQLAREFLTIDTNYVAWVDVGTAAMNMLNMAHALGLGGCPVTSFSKSGVAAALKLPPHIVPHLLLMFGHPKPIDRGLGGKKSEGVKTRDLTSWESYGAHDPS